jgi:hypothetical protein
MDFGQRLGQENLGLKIADILPDLDLRIERDKRGSNSCTNIKIK